MAAPAGWEPDPPGRGAWAALGALMLVASAVAVVAFVWWLIP